ncbi:MAG: DUF1015 domain-containing protein [Desulfobacterales bacterium]|jgi:uncharacterized protein (DUF1015 family)
MAEIKPFRAWRYNQKLAGGIDDLISPSFDEMSEKYRLALYDNPYNSIHLSVPVGKNPPQRAAGILADWKQKNILLRDPVPGIYVYFQYFTLPGSRREYCRKGFICNLRVYDWDENVVLRHENTNPGAVGYRVDLLAAMRLHVSPTHGLYTDRSFDLEHHMDQSMRQPIYETEDYQGVRDVLSVIDDEEVINLFIDKLEGKQIILADGHHRYEGSIAYMKQQMADNPSHTGMEAYNYHLIYLTNTESDDIRILPTHRLIKDLDGFDESAIMKKFEKNFFVKPLADVRDIDKVILGKKWTFGVLFKENAYRVRLKPEAFSKMSWDFPEEVKRLDLSVMHYFIIQDILGIHGKMQAESDCLEYNRSFAMCLKKVSNGEAQMALITRDIAIDEVTEVCCSGCTMPQKSTYFYPKVICGYVFGSIDEDET